jgi:hypothetical protein
VKKSKKTRPGDTPRSGAPAAAYNISGPARVEARGPTLDTITAVTSPEPGTSAIAPVTCRCAAGKARYQYHYTKDGLTIYTRHTNTATSKFTVIGK